MSSSVHDTSRKWEFGVGKPADASNGMMEPEKLLCQLFESGTGDWEMVSSDGQVYKFHSFVVSEQVDNFRVIIANAGATEPVNKPVVVPSELEMTGPAVEAFLRYVYYKDTAPLNSRFKLTCAIIRAGLHYDIPRLVVAAIHSLNANRIRDKTLSWFNFQDLWKLYEYAFLWEENHPLTEKLMTELKSIIKGYCDTLSLADFLKLSATLPGTIVKDLTQVLGGVQSSSPSSNPTVNFKKILSPVELLRKLLDSQNGDWTMIGLSGQGYKFHEAVLKEQVARFRTILSHPETRECSQKKIIVPPEVGLTGLGVQAFLRYVYCLDKSLMKNSFRVTCSIIRAGHYYDIPKMVDAATDVLREKGVIGKNLSWFNFPVLWKLYQQVWLWEESHPSKKRLMETLYTIIKELCKEKAALKTSANTPREDEPLIDLIGKLVQEQTSPAISQNVSSSSNRRNVRGRGGAVGSRKWIMLNGQ